MRFVLQDAGPGLRLAGSRRALDRSLRRIMTCRPADSRRCWNWRWPTSSAAGHAAAMRQLRAAIAARMDDVRRVIAASFPPGTGSATHPVACCSGWSCRAGGHRATAPGVSGRTHSGAARDDFGTGGRFRNCLRIGVGVTGPQTMCVLCAGWGAGLCHGGGATQGSFRFTRNSCYTKFV